MNVLSVGDIVTKALEGEKLTREEVVELIRVPETSYEAGLVIAGGGTLSRQLSAGKAEVQGQFAVNISPCPENCMFCSFAAANGVFVDDWEISVAEAVERTKAFVDVKANAMYLMATANMDFGRFIEIAEEVKKHLPDSIPFIANVGDRTPAEAKRMADAGFTGVYHALRMGEGTDTLIPPEQRVRSVNIFKDAGISVGMCVEPVGPEHSLEEIADKILITSELLPAFSGAARRITIPGTDMAKLGMISELRMAQIVGATRLAVDRRVLGICTHEPCTLGAMAGANLFWAESGANPRDIEAKTEEGRGVDVEHCRTLFREASWDILPGPSRYFSR